LRLILRYKKAILLLFFIICLGQAYTQCITPFNTFPFFEGFENSDGGWITGGANTDWAWGIPAKSVISSAGGGSKCWMVGGLSGNSYANSEASWLQSPCFDFSTLKFPYLSFKVFWESEKIYDGASIQYSTDNGTTWKDIGSSLSSTTSCLNVNWYNTNSVRFLSGLNGTQNGWSGNIQNTSGSCQGGGGSNGWVVAKHTLIELAGQPSVIFRFVFGAGSTCNNFDGFAVDDFTISEAPKNKASFTYSCGDNNSINFTNTSALCPTDFDWNFDDVASGAANVSRQENPTHQFISPGKHTITFIAGSQYNQADMFNLIINTIQVSATLVNGIKCFGDNNGEVQANTSGTTNTVQYTWNTNPVQNTGSALNLKAGTYTVTATAPSMCPVNDSITLMSPSKVSDSATVNQPGCIYTSGEVQITTSGGTQPYTYSWSPNVSNQSTATGLAVGRYSVLVSDKNGCTDLVAVDIIKIKPPVVTTTSIKNVTCYGGKDGSASINISDGLPPYSIRWDTNPIQKTDTAIGLSAGSYIVNVGDANGCKVSAAAIITEPEQISNVATVTNATCGLKNGKILLDASGNYQYEWSPFVSTESVAENIYPGIYSVVIRNSNGCSQPISDIWVKNIGNPAKPFLGNDTSICTGETIVVMPGNFDTYLWQDNTNSSEITISQTGKYWVKVTNGDGCMKTDTINVKILEGCIDLYFPNTFSPNNDGLNETFGPTGNYNAVSNYELLIFNRWGELVFKTNNPRERWNGKTNGQTNAFTSYVWYSSYQFMGQGKKFKKGSLIILQ
jgi:gliding motility-associated-like protein